MLRLRRKHNTKHSTKHSTKHNTKHSTKKKTQKKHFFYQIKSNNINIIHTTIS
uniref:Uncharacterized protein n=1 Tax=viral metagenome TaxID=1070528 RepID=A0A6C0LZM3_9ZZZZ